MTEERWPRWPLVVAGALWLVGGGLAWQGHVWPVAILVGLGVVAGVGGLVVLVFTRRATAALQSRTEKRHDPRPAASVHARNRRAGKRARKRR